MRLRLAVSNELISRGFKREERMHLKSIDKDLWIWVDTQPIEEGNDISPFVGIRSDSVENLVSELLGLPYDEWVGTVGANVGYITRGEYRSWETPSELNEVLSEIEMAIKMLQEFASLEKLSGAWEFKGAKGPGWHYQDIAISILRGRRDEALEKLKEAHSIYCKSENEMCQQFKGYEKRVKAKLGVG